MSKRLAVDYIPLRWSAHQEWRDHRAIRCRRPKCGPVCHHRDHREIPPRTSTATCHVQRGTHTGSSPNAPFPGQRCAHTCQESTASSSSFVAVLAQRRAKPCASHLAGVDDLCMTSRVLIVSLRSSQGREEQLWSSNPATNTLRIGRQS